MRILPSGLSREPSSSPPQAHHSTPTVLPPRPEYPSDPDSHANPLPRSTAGERSSMLCTLIETPRSCILTDPAKADNPILYASDGFVKVTGYARSEIIPRNCRFLQCRHRDMSAVKRLGQAIDAREESVELLLNQKKSGEPFWNLLYTTPLFDATRNVVFFLGGQIICSTTVHNPTDVLKILSQSNDTDERAVDGVMSPEPPRNVSRTSKFFNSSRIQSRVERLREPGMEYGLLNKFEKM